MKACLLHTMKMLPRPLSATMVACVGPVQSHSRQHSGIDGVKALEASCAAQELQVFSLSYEKKKIM